MTLPYPKTDADWQAVCDQLARLPTHGTEHMTEAERWEGVKVMLGDLHRLAAEDGCIAAGWALGLASTVALREAARG